MNNEHCLFIETLKICEIGVICGWYRHLSQSRRIHRDDYKTLCASLHLSERRNIICGKKSLAFCLYSLVIFLYLQK